MTVVCALLSTDSAASHTTRGDRHNHTLFTHHFISAYTIPLQIPTYHHIIAHVTLRIFTAIRTIASFRPAPRRTEPALTATVFPSFGHSLPGGTRRRSAGLRCSTIATLIPSAVQKQTPQTLQRTADCGAVAYLPHIEKKTTRILLSAAVMCSPRPRQRSDAVGGEGERGVGGPSPWAVAHDRGVTTAAALRCGGEKKNNGKENEKFLLENHARTFRPHSHL